MSFSSAPLATSLRPKNLDEFVGQPHLVGPGKPLRIAIENKTIFSMIFWGPPGVGKTTLARILAKESGSQIHQLSAVSAGKADIRKIVESPQPQDTSLIKTVLFLDEIHRFNKAQQDYLLPFVETGRLILIGATTENPSFEVIPPLLSRCRIFVLNELSSAEMKQIITRAVTVIARIPQQRETKQSQRIPARLWRGHGLQPRDDTKLTISKTATDWLVAMANGDARQAITMLDNAHTLYGKLSLTALKSTLQNSFLRFDKKGEEHYNTISAFIKSMRASDIDAAVYYLARMIEAGEDPKFIARRMVVFASEDIGIANSSALMLANQVFEAVTKIGYPECSISLVHGVVYLAKSPKNRSAYNALRAAQADVKQHGNLPIPMELRNLPAGRQVPPTQLMKDLGYGKPSLGSLNSSLLPDKLKDKKYLK